MDTLKEKVAYIKGLAEGLEVGENSKEGKVIVKILDALGEFADVIKDFDGRLEDAEEYLEVLDYDLADLEEDFYGEDEDEEEDDDSDYDDSDYVEVVCPHCKEAVYLDDELFDDDEDDDIICPNCGELILFEDDENFEDEDTEE